MAVNLTCNKNVRLLFRRYWFFRKGFEKSFLIIFLWMTFQEKCFSCYILLPKFHENFASWDIGQYIYCNYLFHSCKVINFEIKLIVLIKLFFYIFEQKELLNWNKKAFFVIFKWFQSWEYAFKVFNFIKKWL